jgi:hypothetical protein
VKLQLQLCSLNLIAARQKKLSWAQYSSILSRTFRRPVLKTDDFYIVRNRWVWDAFTRLHERRAPIDYLTVCEELEQQGQLAKLAGQLILWR